MNDRIRDYFEKIKDYAAANLSEDSYMEFREMFDHCEDLLEGE